MKITLFLLTLLLSSHSFSQISKSDRAQVLRILGKDFRELPGQSNYMKYWECINCIQDTSLIIVGQSNGVHLSDELIIFHDIISVFTNKEAFKAIELNYVTVNEYKEFEHYVRDSIARYYLFYGVEPDAEASKWLDYDIHLSNQSDLYIDTKIDVSDRSLNADLYGLNWKRKLDYFSVQNLPLLADMYYPQPESYWYLREFDRRKLRYQYIWSIDQPEGMTVEDIQKIYPYYHDSRDFTDVQTNIVMSRDEYCWGLHSTNTRDYSSVLAQSWPSKFDDKPVSGVINCQAKAYCHWKSVQLQRVLDKKGIDFTVKVTLPTKDDISKSPLPKSVLTVEERNYTEHWQITNEDYKQFLDAVRDSSMRDYFYHNLNDRSKAVEFLEHTDKPYFDLGWLEFREFNPKHKYLRYYFPLNLNRKIDLNDEKIDSLIQEFNSIDSLSFTYCSYEMRSYERAIAGEHTFGVTRLGMSRHRITDSTRWVLKADEATGELYGRDFSIENINSIGEDQTVMRHSNLQMYTFFRPTNIRPSSSIDSNQLENLIQTISYDQAKAYYNWKYPIQFVTDKSDWQDYVFPTKEQFEAIQRGEQVLVESKTIEYPSPSFRYVVHLFPKKSQK